MNTDAMKCCEQLSCKTMYYRPDERPGRIRESDTVDFFCLRTMTPVGPDGAAARPSMCQSGRSCYEADED